MVIDGYEDEPAAFGVPNYVGFHIRYICAVLESLGLEYSYMTIDDWRLDRRRMNDSQSVSERLGHVDGAVILAGAVVPGKYMRGTPISQREANQILLEMPAGTAFVRGWAIRAWRQSGWTPLRKKYVHGRAGYGCYIGPLPENRRVETQAEVSRAMEEVGFEGGLPRRQSLNIRILSMQRAMQAPLFTRWSCTKVAFGTRGDANSA